MHFIGSDDATAPSASSSTTRRASQRRLPYHIRQITPIEIVIIAAFSRIIDDVGFLLGESGKWDSPSRREDLVSKICADMVIRLLLLLLLLLTDDTTLTYSLVVTGTTSDHRRRLSSFVVPSLQKEGEDDDDDDHHHHLINTPSLSRLAYAAIRTGRVVQLNGRTLSLRTEFVLPTGASLTICGPGTIVGDCHTLFKLSRNRSCLNLQDCNVIHLSSSTRLLQRELGGAIFALANSRVQLSNCTITSEVGYGLWLVQRSVASLSTCRIENCGRSGIVCFGHAKLNLTNTTIDNCALHGICTRGNTQVSLVNCFITNSGVRGLYAYHNATLSLQRTIIEGTKDELAAAVQIEALRIEDSATLLMDNVCVIRNNMGEDLKISGRVERKMIL
jgi:hypothetical protein